MSDAERLRLLLVVLPLVLSVIKSQAEKAMRAILISLFVLLLFNLLNSLYILDLNFLSDI